MKQYMGHPNQVYGVEEMRLSGGKAEGMRMLYVRNGKGLEFWISLDRCGDVSRLSLKGDNFGYFAPCGYVSPQFYDNKGNGFLNSFTAGFFTTCGLTAVGSPCVDNGEELPLHGTISNTPCETYCHWIDGDGIHIALTVRDAALFSHQLLMKRSYLVSLGKNEILLTDTVMNIGSADTPYEILYHCNMGYPLLSEHSVISIPAGNIIPRNEHAKKDIENCLKAEKPQRGYTERCYYHEMTGKPTVSIYNPEIKKGLEISYDTAELPCFTQWKMMGEYDYVMGLEPGNCLPDGRDVMRKSKILVILCPEEERTQKLKFTFTEETSC